MIAIILAVFLQDPPKPDLIKTIVKQITIGGQIRLRAEYRDPLAYATGAQTNLDEDLYLTRIRLNFNFAVTDDIDVFVQPQDSRTWGQEGSVLGNDKNIDLHQGFIEVRNIGGVPLSVKAGRMELQYGDQRQISPLDWHNAARAWDGIRVRYGPPGWFVDGFYTVIRKSAIPSSEEDQDFFGFYASCQEVKDHEFDVYGLFRLFGDGSFTDELGRRGDERDSTIGGRLKGKTDGFDYSGEACYQTGDYVDADIGAWAAAVTFGYTFDVDWRPRVGVEYTFASGDHDPTDGHRGTFEPLFPYQHFYQGFADIFSWKNGHDLVLHVKIEPCDCLQIALDLHGFWLAEKRDAWYNAAGGVIRRDATGGSSREVGQELDFHVRLTVVKILKFRGGYSHFFAGPFVRDTGRGPDMNWFFLQGVLDF
jgi:hypothetical protein